MTECPAARSPRVKLLDAEVVSVLRALDQDGTLLPRLIDAYRRDARRLAAQVKAGAHTLEGEQICRAAHGLRGASMSLGLIGLSPLCQELEALGEAGRFDLVAAKLAQLELGLEQALEALGTFPEGPA